MNITPTNVRIRALFQSSFYKIPRFQRPYSWDRGNIEEFWSDAIATGKDGYFIGSMVLFGEKGSQDLAVVDGQQRLTTITIFLAALRDTLMEAGETDLAHGIQSIIERKDMGNKLRYVLKTESSYPYFQEHIQKLGAPELKVKPGDEEKGIQSAYDFARQKFEALREASANEKKSASARKTAIKKKLEAVRDALLGLDVIIIQLDNEDDAYVVFETLNTRGKDLEPTDLIKNLLARLLKPKSEDVDPTKIKWKSMLDALSQSAANIDASTYIHHFWLSRHDYTPEKTLFKKVKKQVNKANAKQFLDDLVADVTLYRQIFEPNAFTWSNEAADLKRSLEALGIFKVRQPTPLILALLRGLRDKRISLKQARQVMAAVERFHFMHTAIAGLSSSGGLSMMYASGARELSSEDDEQKRSKHLQEFRKKLSARLPDEQTFRFGFGELRFSQTQTRDKPLIKYILERADAALRGDAIVDYAKMTIEHIGPQSPVGGTPLKNFASIGNLVLVSEELNLKLKNKGFAEKKKIMKEAGLPLDPTLEAATQWTSKEVDSRTIALATSAYIGTI